MDAEAGAPQNSNCFRIQCDSRLCWANWLRHETLAEKMVSQLLGFSRTSAFLSPETVSVASCLSVASFNRFQLELSDSGLEIKFSILYRSCNQVGCDSAYTDLCNYQRNRIAIETWSSN